MRHPTSYLLLSKAPHINVSPVNDVIYPEYEATSMRSSPFVMRVPLRLVHVTPTPMLHITVSMAIRHYMFRHDSTHDHSALLDLRSRYHHHRGLAIRALNDDIAEERQSPYILMVQIIMFVFAEVRSPNCTTRGTWTPALILLNPTAPAVANSSVEIPHGCSHRHGIPTRRYEKYREDLSRIKTVPYLVCDVSGSRL